MNLSEEIVLPLYNIQPLQSSCIRRANELNGATGLDIFKYAADSKDLQRPEKSSGRVGSWRTGHIYWLMVCLSEKHLISLVIGKILVKFHNLRVKSATGTDVKRS